jgi:hypothetical protein
MPVAQIVAIVPSLKPPLGCVQTHKVGDAANNRLALDFWLRWHHTGGVEMASLRALPESVDRYRGGEPG